MSCHDFPTLCNDYICLTTYWKPAEANRINYSSEYKRIEKLYFWSTADKVLTVVQVPWKLNIFVVRGHDWTAVVEMPRKLDFFK